MTTVTFSAALLAGGKSSRMGRDKALLVLPGSEEPLWQRQWNILRELQPAEIFWSGHPRPGLPEDICVIQDAKPNAGPLAGIGACLAETRSDLLIVLAVDLPHMTSMYLRLLLVKCSADCGAVVRGEFYEPLAAIYPKALQHLAAHHLAQGRHAMQDFVREAIELGRLRKFHLDEKDAALFRNLNSPDDLPRGR
jgi:molybdopterin-guanine dinucleotide biosynthesis protein A